jgi:hypothetical protein
MNLKSIREYAALAGTDNERYFIKLSESEQASYTEQTASILLERLKSITETKDFASDGIIEKIRNSRGNAVLIKEYVDAVTCINKLSSVTGKVLSVKTAELQDLIEFMQTRMQYFVHGFENNAYLVTSMYMSMVLTVLQSTSTLILRGIDYVKTPRGDFEIKSKTFDAEDDVILSSLSATVANIRSGKVDTFLKSAIKKEDVSLSENVFIITSLAVFVIWLIINIRNIVYLFLRGRKDFASWLGAYADYIEMHAASIAKDRKDVARRQEKVAGHFRKLAEIFAVESQIANRTTLSDTKKQDIEVSGEGRNAQSSTPAAIII